MMEDTNMNYEAALRVYAEKLGTHKIMALAASVNDLVSVRNVSCIFYDDKIYFKTDKEFRKTRQLLSNPNVALCSGGVSVEGVAKNLGLLAEQADQRFAKLYQEYWATSYNAYPHKENEILIEVAPRFVEIWDQREDFRGFQILIDMDNKTATQEDYD